MQQFPPRVVIREVGLRDGLQSIQTVLPTERKIEWIRGAYAAGQREIEVGSFVPAHLLPQLADTAELVAFAKTLPGLLGLGAGAQPQGRRARHRRRGRPAAGAAVREPRAQPRQPAQDARRSDRRVRPDPRRARRRRLEDAARGRHRHRLRLHDPGRGRDEPRCCAACRACSTPAPTASASPTPSATPARPRCASCSSRRAGSPASASGAATSTTRAASPSPTSTPRSRPASPASTPRLAGIGGCPHAPGASGNASSEDLAFMLASMGIDDRHRHRQAARAARQGRRLARAARRCTARSGAPACPRPTPSVTATPVAA